MRPTYLRDDQFTGSGSSPGSREHFYHFLIGYLLPLVHSQCQARATSFLVLDCGPTLTPILSETLARLNFDFEIVSRDEVETRVYVEAWDKASALSVTNVQSLRSAVALVKSAWADYECNQDDCPQSSHLVLQRSVAEDFYLNGSAEIMGYGLSRRSIVNLEELGRVLADMNVEHAFYEPGRHTMGCQIATFQRARRIVGIRGAEWANGVWFHPDCRSRILNPVVMEAPTLLLSLFHGLGLSCDLVSVQSNYPAEDPTACANFLMQP